MLYNEHLTVHVTQSFSGSVSNAPVTPAVVHDNQACLPLHRGAAVCLTRGLLHLLPHRQVSDAINARVTEQTQVV